MCSASSIPYPDLAGARFTSLTVSLVSNLTIRIPAGGYTNHGAVSAEGVSFCHVTTTYNHNRENDTTTVDVYLPASDWNGRMQGIGGGGCSAGGLNFPLSSMSMLGAVADGYSAVTTNAGHASLDPYDWILSSPGNLNTQLLENLASTSLNELSIIGKAVTESYYGKPPAYSYWNGCSQGGRQGMKLAEKYPTAFNGIAASAPAIDLVGLGMGSLWPQVVMNSIGQYPKKCELIAITEAAIRSCDSHDAVNDHIISYLDICRFDPHSVVNEPISCNDTGTPEIVHISEAAAKIANATWAGARTLDGSVLWWGLMKGARLVEEDLGFINPGLATTTCSNNGTCVGKPAVIAEQWIRLFLEKDPSFDISTVTTAEFENLFQSSMEEYGSMFNVEPNLDSFRDAGGKILSYHGLVRSQPSDILLYLTNFTEGRYHYPSRLYKTLLRPSCGQRQTRP